LYRQLEHALATEDLDDIALVARLYDESGRLELFRARVSNSVSKPRAERILGHIGTHSERPRLGGRSRMRITHG
jgi:hypothetical protein